MSRKVEIESTRRLLDDVFQVEEAVLRHELPGGGMSPPVRRLNFERGDSAAALIVHRERRSCVLTGQFRYPAHRRGEGWLLEIPAGMVEGEETPEASIRREIVEEIGYRVGELIRIAVFFPSPGGSSERIHLYCALVGDGDRVDGGGGNRDENEAIEVRELPLAEVMDRVAAGRVSDGKTLLALYWLQVRLERGELLEGG